MVKIKFLSKRKLKILKKIKKNERPNLHFETDALGTRGEERVRVACSSFKKHKRFTGERWFV